MFVLDSSSALRQSRFVSPQKRLYLVESVVRLVVRERGEDRTFVIGSRRSRYPDLASLLYPFLYDQV